MNPPAAPAAPAAPDPGPSKVRRGAAAAAVALVLLSLTLSLYGAWSLTTEARRQSQAVFTTLAKESERVMLARLDAFAAATRAGAGMVQSSEHVTRAEWRTFAETVRLRFDHPGMAGLGWIEHVAADELTPWLARVRADAAPGFRVHPDTHGATLDVVTYLEPEIPNATSLGLNLAVDARTLEATVRATATGLPTLSRPMPVTVGDEPVAGMLLLQAVYRAGEPLGTPERRRRALRGFVYAPLQAAAFIVDTTPEQGRSFDVSVIDGDVATGELVAQSHPLRPAAKFDVTRTLTLHGRQWSLVWRSTPEFDEAEYSARGLYLLCGGLLFSGLLAVCLTFLGRGREPAGAAPAASDGSRVLPVATALLIAGAGVVVSIFMWRVDDARATGIVEREIRHLEHDFETSTAATLQALRRMAHRWSSGGGTPYVVWRNDARDFLRQTPGLEQLLWIDASHRAQWSEGTRNATSSIEAELHDNPKIMAGLTQSAASGKAFITPPREIAPGESGFSVYVPLQRDGRFDGFLAASFGSQGFFREMMDFTARGDFALAIKCAGVTYFDNGLVAARASQARVSEVPMGDRTWLFLVNPTQRFLDAQRSPLPWVTAVSSVLVALLAALWLRQFLVARRHASEVRALTDRDAEREARHRRAFAAMDAGTWEMRFDSRTLMCSPPIAELLGMAGSREDIALDDFLARVHADDQPALQAALVAAERHGQPFALEFRVSREDGEPRWLSGRAEVLLDTDGHATRIAGSLQDITARRQQQLDLARSETQLRLLIEQTPAAVAMFDREMRYIMTSRRWLEDYDLAEDEIVGRCHYDVFPVLREQPHWLEIQQRALRGEKFERREDTWTQADGSTQWSEWAIHPWLDAAGQVGGIVLFTEDITARKQAEAALLASEAMNRAAIDKSPIGKALVHPSGRFIKVNPALCRLLGYGEHEMLARDFQSITHRDDLNADLTKLRALLEGRIASYQMEKRYFHRDGRVIWAQLLVSLVRNAAGEPDFLVSQIQDITERKALEDLKDEFVDVVRRELAAPLADLRDALGLIASRREGELGAGVRRLVELSRAKAERMAVLVRDVHDLEELGAGAMRFDLKDQPVAALTREAILANAAMASEHGVSLAIAGLDPGCVVFVDAARVVQVLTHLISNAVRFSPAGATVELGAERRGGWVRLFVRDTGEGISEDFRARIFTRFSQAAVQPGQPGQPTGGAGLGLHIAKRLVEQMQGQIGFVSQVGAGTTFWVDLPIVSRGESTQAAS